MKKIKTGKKEKRKLFKKDQEFLEEDLIIISNFYLILIK